MLRRATTFLSKGKVGYAIPESQVFVGMPPKALSTAELFGGRKVLLFAVPGAFTGNCNCQLPEFAKAVPELKTAHGVDEVMCAVANDSFVCENWLKEVGVTREQINIVSDPNHSLLKNLGHEIDLPVLGGDRFARVAMIVEDGVIKQLWKEKDGKSYEATKPENLTAANASKE
jgi:peroxiredoxin